MSIENVSGVRSDIAQMLSKIRDISNNSKAFAVNAPVSATNSFDSALSMAKDAIGHVNDLQIQSENVKTSYITGDGNVSMAQVIVASQKSKLAFEGLVTVRNKILEAYKEIMNMPV